MNVCMYACTDVCMRVTYVQVCVLMCVKNPYGEGEQECRLPKLHPKPYTYTLNPKPKAPSTAILGPEALQTYLGAFWKLR